MNFFNATEGFNKPTRLALNSTILNRLVSQTFTANYRENISDIDGIQRLLKWIVCIIYVCPNFSVGLYVSIIFVKKYRESILFIQVMIGTLFTNLCFCKHGCRSILDKNCILNIINIVSKIVNEIQSKFMPFLRPIAYVCTTRRRVTSSPTLLDAIIAVWYNFTFETVPVTTSVLAFVGNVITVNKSSNNATVRVTLRLKSPKSYWV